MAKSKARSGAGTHLYIGDGTASETFAKVVEILTLKQSGKKVDLIEVTNQDSEEVNGLIYREKITGLADGGDMDFTANYIPGDTAQEAFADAFDGLPHNFRIVLPGNPASSPRVSFGYWSFTGYITGYDHDYPLDKQMTISGKISMTGPDTFTEGAVPA